MRFDQALAARAHASRHYEPREYPKYVTVNGKSVLALDAEHEAELLADALSESDGESFPVVPNNLLSQPEKRGPGRPRIVRPDKD